MRDADGVEKKMNLPAKVVTGFAIASVLSFGLCGVGVLKGFGGDGQGWWDHFATYCANGFYFCAAGLVVSLIWLFVDKSTGRDR